MSTSQNRWPVHTSSGALVPLRWVTGRVVGGDVHAVFDYLCGRFDAEVEPIAVEQSWGWAYRAIRGSTSGYSNHASGTAIDLNAPRHPLGRRGTFTAEQVAAIRAILRDLGGAVRWGGDYASRADEMHFEIDTDPATLRRVVEHLEDAMTPEQETRIITAIKDSQRAVGLAIRDTRRALGIKANEVDDKLDELIGKD